MAGVAGPSVGGRGPVPDGPVSSAVVELLHSCVRAALGRAAVVDSGWRWTADDRRAEVEGQPTEFLRAVAGHRVAGLLAPAVETLELPDQLAAGVRTQARRVMGRSLAQAGWLHEVHRRLAAADIPVLFLKGLAVEAQTGRQVGDRGGGDVDIWVARDRVVETIERLRPDWVLPDGYPTPGPSWAWRHWLRWGSEIPLDGPVSVDLHWGLHGVRGDLPDFAAAWAAREMVAVGGRRVPTLSASHALSHACRHAETDRWRFLYSLVDVHLLARRVEASAVRRSDATLQVVDRAIGLPPPWAAEPVPPDRWAEAVMEQQLLGSHGQRTRLLSRPAYLRRVARRFTAGGPPSLEDGLRLFWLMVLPPPWSLGRITTASSVRGTMQGALYRLRSEVGNARDRRRDGARAAGGGTAL